mmetsp:Transcript_22598/g.38722  ORF Transcript_22598/g.38722 Transcript_22598/m.38722 type:complete len:101 (-) Transcript_22598:240-542(-)
MPMQRWSRPYGDCEKDESCCNCKKNKTPAPTASAPKAANNYSRENTLAGSSGTVTSSKNSAATMATGCSPTSSIAQCVAARCHTDNGRNASALSDLGGNV